MPTFISLCIIKRLHIFQFFKCYLPLYQPIRYERKSKLYSEFFENISRKNIQIFYTTFITLIKFADNVEILNENVYIKF